ncbi:MAG TPA: prephenate dehydratase [Terriglobales bacterium]|nr:prephenate dehydratase [Terriglobales bacterium]
MPPPRSLEELRTEIDRLDDRLIKLLNQRAAVVVQVGELKSRTKSVYFTPDREKRVYQRVLEQNRGPLDDASVRAIYREIIAACLSLERPLRVACLGPEGTFSHEALERQFGTRAEAVLLPSFSAVFDEVEHGRVDYGIVPVENSTHGVVAETLDRFVASPLNIKSEALLRIDQCLLSKSGRVDRIKRIVSHPQSLGQCRQWLAEHLPQVPLEEVASNARAAERARDDSGVAAVAGLTAAHRYKLRVVARNIQDQANNFTRFFVIGRDPIAKASGDDKSSLLLSVSHTAGALHRVLKPFADHQVSLCSIESRPLKGRPWEYLFFLDLVGHVDEPRVKRALAAVAKRCHAVKVLGSYPAALPPP